LRRRACVCSRVRSGTGARSANLLENSGIELSAHSSKAEHVRESQQGQSGIRGIRDRALDADKVSGKVRANGRVDGEDEVGGSGYWHSWLDWLEQSLLLRVASKESKAARSALLQRRWVLTSLPSDLARLTTVANGGANRLRDDDLGERSGHKAREGKENGCE